MADSTLTPNQLFPGKRIDVLFAAGMMGIIALLVLPIPTALLSVFLAANLSLAVLVLLVPYSREPLLNLTPSQASCW